jgi:hypothetical protein
LCAVRVEILVFELGIAYNATDSDRTSLLKRNTLTRAYLHNSPLRYPSSPGAQTIQIRYCILDDCPYKYACKLEGIKKIIRS